MNQGIKLMIKGFIIGLGKIIPGVSGAVLAMSLNVYEPALSAISNLKKSFFDSVKYLFPLLIGILLSIIIGSRALLVVYKNYYLQTVFLLIGIMLQSLSFFAKSILNNSIKNNIISIIIVLIILIPIFLKNRFFIEISNNTITYIFSGLIDAFASIVPGISGTALLIILGTYSNILSSLASVMNLQCLIKNIGILLPFFIGSVLGIYFISKIINFALKNYKNIVHTCILYFIFYSIAALLIQINFQSYNFLELIIAILFLFIGVIIFKFVKF